MLAVKTTNLLEELTNRAVISLRETAGDAPLSIFIDPTLADPLRDLIDLRAEASDSPQWSRERVVRLPHIHDDFDPERSPYLLWLPSEARAERVVNAALRVAMAECLGTAGPEHPERSVCGIVIGDAEPQRTAQRLACAARVVRPDGVRWYLRYWDPRVRWHLSRILPAGVWGTLASYTGSWWGLDPYQQSATVSKVTGEGAHAVVVPLMLSQPVWDRLGAIGPTNQVLAMARDWKLIPSPALAQRVENLLYAAAELGFVADGEAIVFAAAGITSHDQFHRHPQVAQALATALHEGRPLADALSEFDEAFWSEVRAGRWSGPQIS